MTFGLCSITIFYHLWSIPHDDHCMNCLTPLQWRHNEHDGISNHQPYDCLLNRLFRRISKKTSKLRVTGLWLGNSMFTGEFPAQKASNEENVSIWWRYHDHHKITIHVEPSIMYNPVGIIPFKTPSAGIHPIEKWSFMLQLFRIILVWQMKPFKRPMSGFRNGQVERLWTWAPFN